MTYMLGSYHIRAPGDIKAYNQINPGIGLERTVNQDIGVPGSWLKVSAGAYTNSFHRPTLYTGVAAKPTIYENATTKVRAGVEVGRVEGYTNRQNPINPNMATASVSVIKKDAHGKEGAAVDFRVVPPVNGHTGVVAVQVSKPFKGFHP